MNDKVGITIACSAFAVLGLKIIQQGVGAFVTYARLKKKGAETVGIITAVKHAKVTLLSNGGYIPELSFEADGRPICGVPINVTHSRPPLYEVGGQYAIFYERVNPVKFVVKSRSALILNTATTLFGVLLVFASVLGILRVQ